VHPYRPKALSVTFRLKLLYCLRNYEGNCFSAWKGYLIPDISQYGRLEGWHVSGR
jgi:hypothetical protein